MILDISTVSRWSGPPVGIVRREHELARYALSKRPDIAFSFFDLATSSFRAVERGWIERLSGWNHAIDPAMPAMAPAPQRLAAARLALRRVVDWALRQLQPPASPAEEGSPQRCLVPMDMAIGAPLELGPDDVIVSVGNDWVCKDAATIAMLKQRFGFRFVAMCHDLIPLMYPALFPEGVAAQFQRHWTTMFAVADCVLVNSRTIEGDIRAFCRDKGLIPGEIRLVQPGCDLGPTARRAPLPMGLEPGKFALFVATVEPRKGHAMLIDVWRRLLAEGVPQRRNFKLVFAGSPGWNVEDVLAQIADPSAFEGTLLHVSGADDLVLGSLYKAAAFCLLPSLYEGFGVPVVEAFAHGKAVIASNGGALPEVIGPLSPCLPPRDSQAWLSTIRQWIEDEAARAPYEARIRGSFAHPSWDQAAARAFEAALRDF